MLILQYRAENGVPMPDGQVFPLLERLCVRYAGTEKPDYTIPFSTENLLHGLRVMIVQGKVSYDAVRVEYNGQHIPIHPDGVISDWPEGFCAFNMECFRVLFSVL